MEIKELKARPGLDSSTKLHKSYHQFDQLLTALKSEELSKDTIHTINAGIDALNVCSDSEKDLRKNIKSTQSEILKLIEKEHKLVIKKHYRNMWMAVGMAAFGIPLGVAFGAMLANTAMLAIGIPIGMVMGIAVGAHMDKKALDEGRQIDFEIKY